MLLIICVIVIKISQIFYIGKVIIRVICVICGLYKIIVFIYLHFYIFTAPSAAHAFDGHADEEREQPAGEERDG